MNQVLNTENNEFTRVNINNIITKSSLFFFHFPSLVSIHRSSIDLRFDQLSVSLVKENVPFHNFIK